MLAARLETLQPCRKDTLFPHTWVTKAALPQLEEHVASLKQHPPVPTGAPDPYEPPK
jgi:arylsulfatase